METWHRPLDCCKEATNPDAPTSQSHHSRTRLRWGWEVQNIEWKTRRIFVTHSETKGKVRWTGLKRGLSFAVAQRIREILLSDKQSNRWSTRAKEQLKTQSQELGGLADQGGRVWRDGGEDRVNWTTFAGAALNGVIGSILEARLSLEASWDDFEISLPPSTEVSAVRELAYELLTAPNLAALIPANQELIDQLKFSACLPNGLARRATQGRLDLSPLKEVLGAVIPISI